MASFIKGDQSPTDMFSVPPVPAKLCSGLADFALVLLGPNDFVTMEPARFSLVDF